MKPRPNQNPFEPGWRPPQPSFEFIMSGNFEDYYDGPKRYVWDGLLAHEDFSVIFGDPDAGKGNFVTSLACAVAGSRPFLGRRAGHFKGGEWLPCGVVYFALERHKQVMRRITAYEDYHGAPWRLPIAVCGEQFDLRGDTTADTLIETFYDAHKSTYMRLEDGLGVANFKPDYNLIIIDTLAMALQGGSDSDPGDLGLAINTIRQVIKGTGAHVLVVHHSPLSGDDRMRGYGSLNAAIDLSLRIERKKDFRVASVLKNSDSPEKPKFYFDLVSFDVPVWGLNEDGSETDTEMLSTPVLVERDAPAPKERSAKEDKKPSGPKASKSEQPVFDALAGLDGPASEEDWRAAYDGMREHGITQGNHRTRFSRGKASLERKGLISNHDGKWSVTVLGVTA